MSSGTAFRIQISTQVTDASGGHAYAFAIPHDLAVTSTTVLDNIKANLLKTTDMVDLGAFNDYPAFTSLSGNIEHCLDVNDSSVRSALVGYNDTVTPAVGEYDVYVYAIDIYKNRAIQKHPQSPIQMITDTLRVDLAPTTLFVKGAEVTDYAEHRNFDVPVPTLNTSASMFDFYNGNIDGLYLLGASLNTSEFIVDSIRVVAFVGSAPGTDQAVIDFVNNAVNRTGIVNVSSVVPPVLKLATMYANVADDSVTETIVFGKEYHVYSVMHDRGLETYHVRKMESVYAGQPPVIQGATVDIVETA